LQRLAAECVWRWFDDLWEQEQVLDPPFGELRARVVPLLEQIEGGPEPQREALIVEVVDLLRTIDPAFLRP
jgi:hypothetical protein